MLKQIRHFIRMLDDADDEHEPLRVRLAPGAVALPQGNEAGPVAPQPATIFVYDKDAAHAASLAAILAASGTSAETFGETDGFVRGLLTRTPALVFLDVSGRGDGAIDALAAMGERDYRGGVQLMGAEISPVVEVVRHMGDRQALQMLPAIRKPLDVEVVRRSLLSQDLSLAPPVSVNLGEALTGGAVEFWYQPKIDLRRRQIAGVESFARISHPGLGTLQPSMFLRGASEPDLVRLSQRAIEAALKAVRNLSEVGIHLRISVNVPIRALIDLPIAEMVAEHGPRHARWPGLLLDVGVDQLAANFLSVATLGPDLVASRVQLAIDDFSGGKIPVATIRKLPIGELKIDRNFVRDCDTDADRAKVCASVINLARHLGCTPVAVGIEHAGEMRALAAMGCDVGQGFIFGQPMPERQLAAMLMRRAVSPGKPQAGSATAAPAPALKRAIWR